ncbi:hypothetical protein L2E82_28564 [Cichorium intybus]|uniref:Uncharacterized protein n=1 Tax=Cichorium intybus TaxID=13427 RepID=A0ACB9CWD4_CICIN|nr:hypothetical protein L2E82_28564 [Cichorium intybus]
MSTTPSPHVTNNHRATTGISSLPTDILESHILTRLDGQTLASATCASVSLSAGQHNHQLWSNICHSAWPSTAGDRISKIISAFSDDKNGPLSFFSQSFPLPGPDPTTVHPPPQRPTSSLPVSELISAVDIYYRNKSILTKTEETETTNDWFRCWPFRIDLLDPKDVVPTQIPQPDDEAMCTALMEDMTLSWILIDPVNKQAVNLSSHKPVSVHRHWLSGEVKVCFVSILGVDGVVVQFGIVVNCGGSEDGEMQVREVTMEVEDMDGKHLNGRDSMVILQKVMEGKRGSGVDRVEEARMRHRRYQEMKRERRERKSRVKWILDILSLTVVLSIFVALFFVFFYNFLLKTQKLNNS